MKPKPVLAALGVASSSSFKSAALSSAAPDNTVNSLDELPYDDTNNSDDSSSKQQRLHLASHIFAHTSSCTDAIESDNVHDGIFSHTFYLLEGAAAQEVFGHLDSSVECKVACLEKGTPRSLVSRPMPHRYWMDGIVDRGDGTGMGQMSLMEFLGSEGCGMVEYGVINYLDRVS